MEESERRETQAARGAGEQQQWNGRYQTTEYQKKNERPVAHVDLGLTTPTEQYQDKTRDGREQQRFHEQPERGVGRHGFSE